MSPPPLPADSPHQVTRHEQAHPPERRPRNRNLTGPRHMSTTRLHGPRAGATNAPGHGRLSRSARQHAARTPHRSSYALRYCDRVTMVGPGRTRGDVRDLPDTPRRGVAEPEAGGSDVPAPLQIRRCPWLRPVAPATQDTRAPPTSPPDRNRCVHTQRLCNAMSVTHTTTTTHPSTHRSGESGTGVQRPTPIVRILARPVRCSDRPSARRRRRGTPLGRAPRTAARPPATQAALRQRRNSGDAGCCRQR